MLSVCQIRCVMRNSPLGLATQKSLVSDFHVEKCCQNSALVGRWESRMVVVLTKVKRGKGIDVSKDIIKVIYHKI